MKQRFSFILVLIMVINLLTIIPTKKFVSANGRPKLISVELEDKDLSIGSYPTLNINSTGCESVQYSVYLYSSITKKWENVTDGYTPAIKGNGIYKLKLKGPVHEGENSFSVWVKKAGASPIDKGGYDDFQSYKVTVNDYKIPKIITSEISKSEQVLGQQNPILNLYSEGEGEVQYRVYLYSPTKKVWEDVTGGYTKSYSANTRVSLKLNTELHEGENSFSVWIKRAGQNPIDKGGYDNFLSYRINIDSNSNISSGLPEIRYAKIDSSQLKLGTYPTIDVSSTGNEQVQYRIYLYSPTKKVWEDAGGGYTSAQNPSSIYAFKSNIPLHSGENSFSIWVKRAGKTPVDKGGYDTFLSYKVNVGSESTSTGLPEIKSAKIDSSQLKLGVSPTININSTGNEQVQYKVYLYSPTKKVWEDAGGGYTSAQKPSSIYAFKSNIPLHLGENSFSIWVKRAGKTPVDKGGYDTFLSYKVNVTQKSTGTAKVKSVSYENSEISVGKLPTLRLKANSDVNVEYKVYLYSQTKGVWDDVSSGYTSSINPNVEKSIKISKPLQPGRNTFSIYVKKAGYPAKDSAGYDTYVHEVINVNQADSRIAKISSTTVNANKTVLGNKPEITVTGKSGDGSKVSYKAFFYSNSQKKWLDATSYTSGIASGSSTKLSLNTQLQEGSNRILIWAKRSSISGEVYESYKEIKINAIKPAPIKKKIMIDPGHGGKDPGAVSTSGTRERDVVLKVGTKLGALLKSKGYEVIYTRTSNDTVAWNSSNQSESLKYRANLANSKGVDMFVSIHCNSNAGTPATGTETFYSNKTPNKDKAFATIVQSELVKSIGLKNRGAKSGNYWVLNNTKMAATIAELGFINNVSDESKLKTDSFQQKCAQGLYNGIVKY